MRVHVSGEGTGCYESLAITPTAVAEIQAEWEAKSADPELVRRDPGAARAFGQAAARLADLLKRAKEDA